MKKLAIITTHPIQYYAPIFRLLHQHGFIEIKVYYTLGISGVGKYDDGFKQNIKWDIPLTDGYAFEWVKNIALKPNTSNFNGIQTPGLINQIKGWKPDALFVFGWSYKSHLQVLRYFHGKVPILFRGDSTLLDATSWIRKRLRWLFLNWVYQYIDYAFYTGTNNYKYFKKFGLKESQLVFAPHAVDNERFAEEQTIDANQIRVDLGLIPDDILILFAGKFESKKDPLLLLQAFLKLADDKTHLLFVGNGNLEDQLKQTSEGNKYVHFLNFQNQTQMPAIYQACDLFCLPSKGPSETWGLAVNEAMACGKAILLSDKVGCAADLVQPGENGYVFAACNEDELRKYLAILTVSKSILKKFGKHSASIIQNWNFNEIATAIEYKLSNLPLELKNV